MIRGRGRGRGRGFGRGGFPIPGQHAKSVPYVLFPEASIGPKKEVVRDIEKMSEMEKESCKEEFILPKFPERKEISDDDAKLCSLKAKLEAFWKDSCYHLDKATQETKKRNVEAEWFSSKGRRQLQAKHEDLNFYLKLTTRNFPAELVLGSKHKQPDNKKLRWDPTGDKRMNLLEKLEESGKGLEDEDDKEKKDESEDEDDLQVEEEESSEDDYNQFEVCDDDDDDMNMEEEEEDCYS